MRLQRLIWPALLAAALGVPVVTALLHHVPNTLDTDMVGGEAPWPSSPVSLGAGYQPGGTRQAQVGFWQNRPERIIGHQEIRLQFVTYGSTLALLGGELRIRGTECVYRAAPGGAITDGRYISFVRSPACAQPFPDSIPGRVDLSVTFRGPGELGLASHWVPAARYDPEWLSFSDPGPAGGTRLAVARAIYIDTFAGPARNRADLLAYTWQLSRSAAWLWLSVGVALVLVFAGGILISPAASGDARHGGASRASGVACLGLALAMLYVVLTPPFQAPDEPDHLLAFADVARRPDLAEGTAALARVGHFDRIRFHGDSRFRPADIGSPMAQAWGPEVFAHDVASRSATTWIWWKMLARVLSSLDAAHTLIALRFANALLFALLLGLAAALVRVATADAAMAPHAVALALLLVPTLPFFATHVSEFAVLTSTYAALAMLVAGLCLDGRRVHLLGLPLGLAIAAVFAGGRSGLPFVAVAAAVMAGRAWLGSRSEGSARDDVGRSVIFWAGLGAGLAAFEWLSNPAFRNGLWPGDAGQVPAQFKAVAELLRVHPVWITMMAPCGFALELGTGWVRRRLGPQGRFVTGAVRWLCYGAALAIVLSLIVSPFVQYPTLDTREVSSPVSASTYASRVLAVALTGARLAHHDLLLSASFWEGFGWIDTLPGDGFVSAIVLMCAAAAIALLIRIGKTGQCRRAIWLAAVACGCVAGLVMYAVSSYYLHRNVMGRYLVGLYLVSVAVVWSVAAILPRRMHDERTWRRGISRESWLAAAACGIHGWALRFILMRYF